MKQLKFKMGHVLERKRGRTGRCHYLFLLGTCVPGFRKTPLFHKQEHFRLKEKLILIFCQVFPKKNGGLVAGQLDINA